MSEVSKDADCVENRYLTPSVKTEDGVYSKPHRECSIISTEGQ